MITWPLEVGELKRVYFNLNDVIQILGLVIIVRELFINQEAIWFPDATKRRKRMILYPEIQMPMMLKMIGLFFIGSATQGILAVALLPLIGRYLLKELLRFIGPIFALNKHLNDDASIEKPLQFRKTDHFRSSEKSFNHFVSRNIKKDYYVRIFHTLLFNRIKDLPE